MKAPGEHHIAPTDDYSGWTRKKFPRGDYDWMKDADGNSIRTPEYQHLIKGHDYKCVNGEIPVANSCGPVILQQNFLSERIRRNCVVICETIKWFRIWIASMRLWTGSCGVQVSTNDS